LDCFGLFLEEGVERVEDVGLEGCVVAEVDEGDEGVEFLVPRVQDLCVAADDIFDTVLFFNFGGYAREDRGVELVRGTGQHKRTI
jgi:hypothetical protein